jgi:hypothetical protein
VTPPKAAQATAKRALEVRAELPKSKRAGLTTQEAGQLGIGSGVARARDIANGSDVDAQQVANFFSRHGGNIAKAEAAGKDMESSKAIQAGALWGGKTMERAALAALKKTENAEKK